MGSYKDFRRAMNGSGTIAIFQAKNCLGMSDRPELVVNISQNTQQHPFELRAETKQSYSRCNPSSAKNQSVSAIKPVGRRLGSEPHRDVLSAAARKAAAAKADVGAVLRAQQRAIRAGAPVPV
jgi:hypothetical protein